MPQYNSQTFNLDADITLNWQGFFNPNPQLYDLNYVDVVTNGANIILPDATKGFVGWTSFFYNVGLANQFNVLANDGVTAVIPAITPGQNYQLTLTDNATTNGTWQVSAFIGSEDPITQVAITSADESIVVTDSPITAPAGTINVGLTDSANNFLAIGDTGYLVVTGTNPLTFQLRTFNVDENLTITDADGVNAATTLGLNTTIQNIANLNAGSITIRGGVIRPAAANINLNLLTQGIGKINLNSVTVDIDSNVTIPGNLTVAGSLMGLSLVRGMISFIDTGTSIIVLQSIGFDTPERTSTGRYTIPFTTTREDTNYTVFTSPMVQDNTDQPYIVLGYPVNGSFSTSSFDIVVMNEARELWNAIPNGITILLLSDS